MCDQIIRVTVETGKQGNVNQEELDVNEKFRQTAIRIAFSMHVTSDEWLVAALESLTDPELHGYSLQSLARMFRTDAETLAAVMADPSSVPLETKYEIIGPLARLSLLAQQ